MGSLVFGAALIGLWATFSWLPFWIQNLVSGTSGQKERGSRMMMMGGGGLLGGFISGLGGECAGTKKNPADLFRGQFYFGILFIQTDNHALSGRLFADRIHHYIFWNEPGSVVDVYS